MSSVTGKRIRLNRLIEAETSTCLIVAIDHGMTSPRFLPGLFDTGKRVEEAIAGGANVLMLGRGMAKAHPHLFRRDTSLALMLTASAAGRPSGATITPVGSVEEGLRAGADAVVVYVALAGENEPEMISYLSRVGETCEFKGMPLIAEAEYPNAYQSLDSMSEALGLEYLKRNARLCAELGADIVKVNWSGDAKSFEEIIRACGKPVVLAGGSRISDLELLTRMSQARKAGAIGCSVGRNVFEHAAPRAMTAAISRIFRDGWAPGQAHEELETAYKRKHRGEWMKRTQATNAADDRAAVPGLEHVRCFLLDMDGTFYLGEALLPGALEFVDILRQQGRDFLFLTNNSSRSQDDYAAKITRLGMPVGREKIFTSGEATARYMRGAFPEARVFLVGPPSLHAEFKAHGVALDESDPTHIILGFDTTLTYAKLWRMCDLVRAGLPYIATHADFNCPTPTGYMPDVGAMIALVRASTGREPDLVVGKPNRMFVEAAAAKLGLPVDSLAMIGDRLYTDIALGKTSGITTILVLSGETHLEDLATSPHKPDLVFADLAAVAAHLRRD